jgi:hypothetical protein
MVMVANPSLIVSFLTLIIVLVFVLLLAGCANVGKGSVTLIPANLGDAAAAFKKYYPDLVTSDESLRPLTPGSTTDIKKYTKYLEDKLGGKDCETSKLSIVVRDRTKIPPFLPVDISIEKELLGLYLNKDIPSEEKKKLAEIAKANLLNVPDLPSRTTIHDVIPGKEKLYFYYPRIQIDFASRLRSPSALDRYTYLGMAVELITDRKIQAKNTEPDAKDVQCDGPRFIDFQPKAADIVEFTWGELTQKADLAAKTSLSKEDIDKMTAGTSFGPDTNQATSGSERSHTNKFAPELSFTMSETFVNALKDSIEARTAGILQQGNTFFTDFRAIKERRIGGTYNFDMMLEVPATLITSDDSSHLYISQPCVTEIRANVYMAAVVRHVYKRGYTGWFRRVPEPDNDKVYFQVVVKQLPNVLLWKYSGVPWFKEQKTRSDEFVVSVTTNREDAKFVVKGIDANGHIYGVGSGSAAQIIIPVQEDDIEVHVKFLDVFDVTDDSVHVFSAHESHKFTIKKGEERSVIGNYLP